MTEEIYCDDAYAKTAQARIVAVHEGGIELERTVFFPMGGGQPGDTGIITNRNGKQIEIRDTIKAADSGIHMHIPVSQSTRLSPGEIISMEINWPRRYAFMRMHTLLHLICAIMDSEVTGCQIGFEKSRIDVNVDEKPDRDVLQSELEQIVARDLPIRANWMTDKKLSSKPDLVRTMSGQPPVSSRGVRLIEIESIDIQPCGGTHVLRTSEIGKLRVGKIENKGKHNRRINVHLDD